MSVKSFFNGFNKGHRRSKHRDNIGIIVNEDTLNGKLEGYNRLRDNILYINTDGNTKVIQFESSVSHEGKTTVACNFAVTLGLSDKKVILVDLDFRKPKVNRNIGLSIENGIAEYILGNSTEEEIIKHSEYKNVDVITRGAKIYNSSVILISEKFKKLIADLREKYDYVILDCPPVMLVSDYIHISQVADGVLFLVAYGSTTKNQVADAIQALRRNNARILGTVFTMYDKKRSSDYRRYYYYHGYYNYYQKSDKEEKAEELEENK